VGILKKYKEDHFYSVMVVFCAAYLYKQTFSIPGSVFMVCSYFCCGKSCWCVL